MHGSQALRAPSHQQAGRGAPVGQEVEVPGDEVALPGTGDLVHAKLQQRRVIAAVLSLLLHLPQPQQQHRLQSRS